MSARALWGHPAARWVRTALFWLPTGIVFTNYFYTLKLVRGRSMQPTLNPDTSQWHDIVLFDRLAVGTLHRAARGDVVALRSPTTPGQLLVKRIIAVGGDTVQTLPPYPDAAVRVPEGHVWVEGDERFHSDDSNRFGPVPLGLLDSRLAFIVWPPDRLGPLARPSLATPPSPAPHPGAPRGPAWRRAVAEVERERWRRSRVTVPESSPAM